MECWNVGGRNRSYASGERERTWQAEIGRLTRIPVRAGTNTSPIAYRALGFEERRSATIAKYYCCERGLLGNRVLRYGLGVPTGTW